MKDQITHLGIVKEVQPDHHYLVLIEQTSACAGCHAKTLCAASDKKEKIIEVYQPNGSFEKGDTVVICGAASMGLKAVGWAFVLPFVLVIAVLFAVHMIFESEPLSAISALLVLLPYYILLYLNKKKLYTIFQFTLKPHHSL